MPRYPHRNGLALPIQELGYQVVLPERRQTSQHHLYFPRRLYDQTPVRHLFRNLVDHVVTMENEPHRELHYRFTGSVLPRRELMVDVMDEYLALHGVIDFVSEKRTSQTYQLSAEQYQNIVERSA